MCMRLGGDSGRNFLSTKDPVTSDAKSPGGKAAVKPGCIAKDMRFGKVHRILEQFYFCGFKGQ